MLDSSIIDAMIASGCTVGQLGALVKSYLAAQHEELLANRQKATFKKRKQRKQQQKQRACPPLSPGHLGTNKLSNEINDHVPGTPRDTVTPQEKAEQNQRPCHVTVTSHAPSPLSPPSLPDKEKVSTPLKEINLPSPLNPPSLVFTEMLEKSDFDVFYESFPHKVGKADAKKAFLKAIKRTNLTAMMNGVRNYIATKPPDRPWCNPSTWLNQDRWEDQPAVVQLGAKPLTWRQKNEETLAKLQQYSDSLPDDRRTGGGAQIGNPLGAPDNPFISTDGGNIPRIRGGFG